MSKLVEETFPLKSILISGEDKVWFTEELRALKRSRLREYTRHGKSEKYSELKAKFDKKFENEFKKYLAKIELEVTEGKRGSAYSALKKLGLRPGEISQPVFQLPQHVGNNLTMAESAEIIADFFSSVSQEYSSLDISTLPPNIKTYLTTVQAGETVPRLSAAAVYRKLARAKKPNSSVPGDLPKKVIKQYAAKLAVPLSVIYNNITNKSVYPEQWKTEHQIPIPKVYPPESEDDLRNISKTNFFI